MIPGQFGLSVPFEILARVLDTVQYDDHIIKILNKVDLIQWEQDNVGDLFVIARTAFEAKLLIRDLGGIKFQIEFIKKLLSNIRVAPYHKVDRDLGSKVIQFAVELITNIGPNGPKDYMFSDHYYEITEILRKLRLSGNAKHPRLMLQEANLLREIVKGSHKISITKYVPKKGSGEEEYERKEIVQESYSQLLARAKSVIKQAIESLGERG